MRKSGARAAATGLQAGRWCRWILGGLHVDYRFMTCAAICRLSSLLLASQGYDVTAVDLSPGMLSRLRAKAEQRGLAIRAIEADALAPPPGDFDAVVERHLLWTLPDPGTALAAWHKVAPRGRLVLVEGTWGTADATGCSACAPKRTGLSSASGPRNLTIMGTTATGSSVRCPTATA
jgi:SAM-dependent methyltransferase